jgi:prepilin-type N-terminal cleavage/methylation domain-containing protein
MRGMNTKRQAGFSLIELAITVVVILILAGIAVPPMFNYVHSARLRGAATTPACFKRGACALSRMTAFTQPIC